VSPTRAKLAFTQLHRPAGRQAVGFAGRFASVARPAAIDPLAGGVRLVIVDRIGMPVVDASIAGGAYDRAARVGWRVNRSRTVWTYRATGPTLPHGIARVRVEIGTRAIAFVVKGRHGHYPFAEDDLPLVGTLMLDPAAAVASDCGDRALAVEAPRGFWCRASRDGAALRCG
jgi:hypothetical protein